MQAAALVPDKKLDHFSPGKKSYPIDQNNLAYHPGPVSLPGGDGSPLFATSHEQPWGLFPTYLQIILNGMNLDVR